MAISITHRKVATLPDEPGAEINKAEWNDTHDVTGLATVAETGSYNDLSNKPTIPASTTDITEGTNLYYTDERVDDRVANLIVAGTGISKSYNDAGNALTLSSTITQYTDALARSAISLTTTGSGAATYNNTTGVLNVPTPAGGVTFPLDGDSATSPAGQIIEVNSENFLSFSTLGYTLGHTYLGYQAGKTQTTGADSNTFVGYQSGSGASATTCSYNTFVGWQAGRNTSSNNNVCVGYLAGPTLSQGSNVYIGRESGYAASSSANNVGIGYQTLYTGTGSNNSQNVAIGREAGYSVTNGQNVFIGYRAGQNVTNAAQNIIIGYNCGNLVSNTTSNHLNIGNAIYGSLGTNATTPGSHTSALTIDGTLTVYSTIAASNLTLGGNFVTSGAYSCTLTLTGTTSVTMPTTGTLATLAGTEQFTNKRVIPRQSFTTSAATITPAGDSIDIVGATAQAANLTIAAPSGTPNNGQPLIIRLKDNGTTQTITWNAIYRAIGVTLPTATVANKTVYISCLYNSADSKWDVTGVAQEA